MDADVDRPLLVMQGRSDDDRKYMLKSYLDSGAARSVCPLKHGDAFGITPSEQSKKGTGFRTATNKRVPNLGNRTIKGQNEIGQGVEMRYAVANVSVALDSISQICDTGATVTFTKHGGVIEQPDGNKIPFQRDRDTYTRHVWVTPPAEQPNKSMEPGFPRQDPQGL